MRDSCGRSSSTGLVLMVRTSPPRPLRLVRALLVSLGLFASRPGTAQTAADSAAAAVAAFHVALGRGDSSSALALLAADAVILESGGLETLGEYRSHHLPADIAFTRAVPSSGAVSHAAVVGSVAWVTTTSTTTGTFGDRAINSQNAELVVLSREPIGWRIRAIHWSSRSRRTGD